jgi:hypothetical protein
MLTYAGQVGVPDILVNCAGCWYIQEFADTDYDTWEEMIDTNIKGYLYVIGEDQNFPVTHTKLNMYFHARQVHIKC